MKIFKVCLTDNRSEIIEDHRQITATEKLNELKQEPTAVLNGKTYPSSEIMDVIDVTATHGSTNMEGI